MGYANPVERYDQRMGTGAFVARRPRRGVDGVLVVDYPPEECERLRRGAEGRRPRPRSSCSRRPRPSAHRSRSARLASGYVYYVSLKGVTGAGHLDTVAVGADAAAHPRRT